MADDKKGFFTASYEFFKSHWGEILTVGHLAGGWLKGRVSDDAPETAKVVGGAMGMSTGGGKGDPADEAFLKWAKSQIRNSKDGRLLETILTNFTPYAFQLNHPEKWVRERGRDAFEEWRVIVFRLGTPDNQVAVNYLTEFSRDILRDYKSVCRKAEIAPWPFDECNQEHRIAQAEAFDNAIEKLKSEGTHVPTGAEAALLLRLKKLASRMGPKVYLAGKKAYDAVHQHIRDNGREYVETVRNAAQHSWTFTKETARNTDHKVAVYARYRKIKDANRPWYIRWVDALL